MAEVSSPRERAALWQSVDPDQHTVDETETLLQGHESVLEERFTGRLMFGTAGLRGALGCGPQRMNRVLVRQVAAALGSRVLEASAPGTPSCHVVIGFDARHGSRDFAEDTARVLAAQGIKATIITEPRPTPVLAYAVREFDAAAGVMVTASHNPAADNGYKVYWRGGAQIVPPIDVEISELIDRQPLLGNDDLAPLDHELIHCAAPELIDSYLDTVTGLLEPGSARTARVAYTPLHGVGLETLTAAFDRAGFPAPLVVAAQAAPDPDFPTTPFPNPEETGVLNPLLTLAESEGADVAFANDPDADRLSIAVPSPVGWRLLSGDELGSLLAHYRLSSRQPGVHLVLNTVVSSRLLGRIAESHGATWIETLTGFKWIMHVRNQHPDADFVLGYEEALGFALTDRVQDKDGISAALVVAEMVGELAAEGRTVLDVLDDLHRAHGVHVTGQRSAKFEKAASASRPIMPAVMERLRQSPPETLGGLPVDRFVDLADGSDGLPPTDGLVFGAGNVRVVIRPSGTEPKVKVYGEVTGEPDPNSTGEQLMAERAAARSRLESVLSDAVMIVTADPLPSVSPSSQPATALGEAPTHTDAEVEGLRRLAVRCVDLTTLEGDDTPGRVRQLCSTALRPDPADPTVGPVAAVCVYPNLIPLAAELLRGSAVGVASVAGGFPAGLTPLDARLLEISAAADGGASEIDIVINRSALLSGDLDTVARELAASREAAGSKVLKVILETAEYPNDGLVQLAAELAAQHGADFLKTSTGKSGKGGASRRAVQVMANVAADHHRTSGKAIGIKVSGGVKTLADALAYLEIIERTLGPEWLTPERFRFGASSLLRELVSPT